MSSCFEKVLIVVLLVVCGGSAMASVPRCEADKSPAAGESADTGLRECESAEFFSDENKTARRKEFVTRGRDAPKIGLALAGGGTRAAQYSIGVLKGLGQSGVLGHVDVISSVSGGGYAAYGYFSRLLEKDKNGNLKNEDEVWASWFRDCLPHAYRAYADLVKDAKTCPERNFTNIDENDYSDDFKYQNNLRGHIDLFTPEFDYRTTNGDQRFMEPALAIAVPQLLVSLLTEPLMDFVFDWNASIDAPGLSSRRKYREGIRAAWGMPPVDCSYVMGEKAKSQTKEQREKDACWSYRNLYSQEYPDAHEGHDVTFQMLREAYARLDNRIPYWIINATTPVLNCDGPWYQDGTCTVSEFLNAETYPPHKAAFEITPFHWGSGEHGYWRSVVEGSMESGTDLDAHGLSVIKSVSAAAAFFDPNEKTVSWFGVPNLLQQALGFKWGYYIPNPVTQINSPSKRDLHRLLPFPFYLLHGWQENKHAVDIHLIDGGQSENLGAVALIRRRVPNIIISDHAAESALVGKDRWGQMIDICNLKNWLREEKYVNATSGDGDQKHMWHIHFDALADLDKVCEKESGKAYDLYKWKTPVVQGCAVEISYENENTKISEEKKCDEWKKDGRTVLNLFLLKPALDFDHWIQKAHDAASGTLTSLSLGEAEVLGFMERNHTTRNGADDGMLFPRHGTVELTIDSSPWLYGAYRELAALAAGKIQCADDACSNLLLNNLPQAVMKPEDPDRIKERNRALTECFGQVATGKACEFPGCPDSCAGI